MPTWSTACPDWETRIVARQSLVPPPIFPAEAAAALEVFKSLRIVDVAGCPTFGEAADDWVFDFVAAVFGSYDADRGIRLIRQFLLLVAKKNIKSTLVAGIMLTALIRNWRHSNELLSLAPTIEAAQNVFKPAADMVRADEELDASRDGFLHVQDHVRTITHLTNKGTLKIVAADSGTVVGKKAAFVEVDELWLFGKMAHADSMLREATGGLVSRPEGFELYITTQSDEPPKGVFKDKLNYGRKVRDGEIVDPKFLAVLHEYPKAMIKAKAYLKPENFYIANPNIGRSVSREWLEDELRKELAKDASTRNTFLAKHFNIEVTQGERSDGWAGAGLWPRGDDPTLTLEALLERCEVVTVGIDGGGLDDLLGLGVIGREKLTKNWLCWCHAYISPEGLERRKANRTEYDDFKNAGELTYVDQLPDDIQQLVAIVEQVKDSGLLAQVGADAAGLGLIIDELAKIGVTEEAENLGAVRQGFGLMDAIKSVERKLADGTLKHAVQALMTWCAGNAIVQPTATGMRIVRDESGFGKVDPLMALFNAAALMARNPEASGSIYTAERGLRSFG